jgi:alpha-L-rhamnosidase
MTPAAAAVAATAPFPPQSWPARLLAVDTWTQGSWRGQYGADGYVLFAYGPGPSDVAALPPWVASVTTFGAKSDAWSDPPPAADSRALQAPGGDVAAPRAIGCAYATYTVAVDIELAGASEGAVQYIVAVYIVDYDYGRPSHEGLPPRRATVAALDRWTLDAAAPVQYVDNYVNGTWLVFEYSRSLRLRMSQLEGDNAVVSAVMLAAVK